MSTTAEQVTAGIRVAAVVGDTIRQLGSIPSGELYAQLMGHMNLDTYNKCIQVLKKAELVEESNHVLRWVGPT